MYLVIVDYTSDNKIAKYQECETRAEADDHLAQVLSSYPNAFIIDNSIPYAKSHTTVDPVAQTIIYDSAACKSELIMNEWFSTICELDIGMPRFLEDLITDNPSLIIHENMKTRYDEKVALRATKP